MKCSSCGDVYNDGVQCGLCKKHLDFGCAQISEKNWQKLGSSKREAWRCPPCRTTSPASSPAPSPPSPVVTVQSNPVSLELVYKEIQDLKSQLSGLPALVGDVRTVKEELSELKEASEFSSDKILELTGRPNAIESRITNVEQLEGRFGSLQNDLANIKAQISVGEQRSRLNNVEIKGVPLKKNENLFDIVSKISEAINFSLSKAQINYLYRVPIFDSKEKYIIVSFLNRYVKEEFVATARARKSITAADIGFQDSQQRVFVNDHLSGDSKSLLNTVKTKAKDMNFAYVWVKYGKIHLRKNDTSPVFVISKESDLNKIS